MAEQATSFVDEGRERLHAARERIDEEVQRVQKELQTRAKKIERQFETGRKNFEKQTRKQVRQIEKDIRKSPIVKQLDRLRGRAGQVVEETLDGVFGVLQVASKSDVKKIDRKLTKLTKRLKDIERARQSNGRAQTPPL